MAAPFEVEYFEDERGRVPFEDWLLDLRASNPRAVAKALWLQRLLEEQGHYLKLPNASHVSGPVWELRGKSGTDPVRIYYFRKTERVYVLVCAELKKRDEADPRLIEIALRAHEKSTRGPKRRK